MTKRTISNAEFVLPFGRYKGRLLRECPQHYVIYLATSMSCDVTRSTRNGRLAAKRAAAKYLKSKWKTNQRR